MKKTSVILLLINTLIWSSLSGFLIGRYYFPNVTNVDNDIKIVKEECKSEVINCKDFTSEQLESLLRKYNYNRIVLHGKDDKNETFYLVMYVVSQQEGIDKFKQFSSLLYSYNGKTRTLWTSEDENQIEILPNGYIKEFENTDFPDLSTRETYNIALDVDGTKVLINIKDLNGDFIVKNKTDYIRYVSSGYAEVSVNGKAFNTYALADKVISSDYKPSILFEGRENLNSKTHSLTLWDDKDNFYHIDITDVENTDLPYKTHRWILYKDSEGNYTKKTFDAKLDEFIIENDEPKKWTISIPDLDNTVIKLEATEYINQKKQDGLVTGAVKDSNGERKISGHFLYEEH